MMGGGGTCSCNHVGVLSAADTLMPARFVPYEFHSDFNFCAEKTGSLPLAHIPQTRRDPQF